MGTPEIVSPRPQLALLGIPALVLLLIVAISYREWRQYHAINAAARDTREILRAIDHIRSAALDAEAAQRGFLLTGEAAYLESFRLAEAALPARFARLQTLLARRHGGPAQAAELKALIDRQFLDIQETIELRRAHPVTPQMAAALSDRGQTTMSQIAALCSAMLQIENAAHGKAEGEREEAAKTALLATIAGSLVLLFFFLAAFQPAQRREFEAAGKSRALAYGAALAATLLATLLRMALTPLIDHTADPFLTYFPAVVFAAWYGGFATAASAILLSTFAGWYYFVSPSHSFAMTNPGDLIGILLFILVSFGIALLSDSQRRAVVRRRQAEDAARGAFRRLEHVNRDLARSNEDLKSFAFLASHDLQEPLRMITVYAQLLVRKFGSAADGDATLCVSNIVDGSRRMQRLLADLLSLAEAGAGGEAPTEPSDLGHVMAAVLQNLQSVIESSGAVIECSPLPPVCAAEAHLMALFQNLIGNAIKYRGDQPPRILIHAEDELAAIHFTVRDNGIGIPAEYQDQIFAVFQRVHEKKVLGSGLGLAICRRVVERYGGRIWVESQHGQGAAFHFTLPAASNAALQGCPS